MTSCITCTRVIDFHLLPDNIKVNCEEKGDYTPEQFNCPLYDKLVVKTLRVPHQETLYIGAKGVFKV